MCGEFVVIGRIGEDVFLVVLATTTCKDRAAISTKNFEMHITSQSFAFLAKFRNTETFEEVNGQPLSVVFDVGPPIEAYAILGNDGRSCLTVKKLHLRSDFNIKRYLVTP